MIKKQFPITHYLEVVLTEDDKTEIWIKGEHFIQCSHVLTTVHTDEVENLLLLESVDDIKEAPQTIVIDPETRFFVHCSNIQGWVENNFDTRMLHSNLSFPLLKKLVESGCVNSMILKEEIAKRFEYESTEMIRFLFKRKYLDSLSKEELSAIITPNFKELIYFLTGSVSKEDHQLLNYLLERSLNEELKTMIKEKLAEDLGREDLDMIRFLVDHGHLDSLSLSKEELSMIIPPNFYLLLKDLLRGRKQDLQLISYLLERSLNEDLKTMVKEDLAKILEKGSLETLYYFYRHGYLEYISKERLSEIVTPKFKRLVKDLFRDYGRISRDHAILGYLLGKSLNEWLKTMVKEEITEIFDHGDSKKIDILIKYNYLDFLSIEELSAIIKPNLSKIVKMDINFKNYLFLLNKEDLSTILTQDVLHHTSRGLLKSLPFEFKTVMKELMRRNFLSYIWHKDMNEKDFFENFKGIFDFDHLFNELREIETAPNREDFLIIIKEEISKMLKENSSTKFLDFLYGYFKHFDKDEFSAILTQDILHNLPIKNITQYSLPLGFKTRIKEALRRYDVGDDTIKNEIRAFFDDFKSHVEFIFYDLLLTLFKRYEVVDDTMKKEIRKYFDVILDVYIDQLGRTEDEFKRMLGPNTLKGMLKTLSMKDILHLRYHRKIIDLQMYKEEVTRRFKSRNSDLRNLGDRKIIENLRNTWYESVYGNIPLLWYDIISPFSKSELLRMLPKKFLKFENIITKLDLNFKIVDIDHDPYNAYEDEFLNLFIFSVNTTEDLVKITIQNYPDLYKNLAWILSELGKIKDVQYIIELWNDDISTLPTSIPNIPIIKLIIDGKIIKKNLKKFNYTLI